MLFQTYLCVPRTGCPAAPIALLLGAIHGIGVTLQAEEPDAAATTIEFRSLAGAVRNNRAWQAARYRIDEARGRLMQAGRLSNPEIEVEFSHSPSFKEGTFGIALTQAFPVTARLDLEKSVSRAELAAAEAELRDALRRLAGKARVIGIRYLALEKQAAIRRNGKALAEALAAFIEKSAAQGAASASDSGQARLEAAQAILEIRKLETEARRALVELKPLLGLEPSEALLLTGELEAPSVISGDSPPVANRQDYIAAKRAEEAAQQEVLLEEARRREDISIGVFTEAERAEDAPEGLENEVFTGFRISIPLPLWNRNEGAVREISAKAKRLAAEREALALEIRNEAVAAKSDMAASAALIAEISDQLLPIAVEQERKLNEAYRSGQGGLQAVLQARRQMTELESARLEALRDYYLAKVRLETALPTTSTDSLIP